MKGIFFASKSLRPHANPQLINFSFKFHLPQTCLLIFIKSSEERNAEKKLGLPLMSYLDEKRGELVVTFREFLTVLCFTVLERWEEAALMTRTHFGRQRNIKRTKYQEAFRDKSVDDYEMGWWWWRHQNKNTLGWCIKRYSITKKQKIYYEMSLL